MFMSSVDFELRNKFPLEWTREALYIAGERKGISYGCEQTAECQTTAQASVKTGKAIVSHMWSHMNIRVTCEARGDTHCIVEEAAVHSRN